MWKTRGSPVRFPDSEKQASEQKDIWQQLLSFAKEQSAEQKVQVAGGNS